MIPNRFIANYIERMTEKDAQKLAHKYGLSFNEEEIALLLPFLKEHRYELHRKNKDYLLSEVKKVVPSTTYMKIEMILSSFL